ncbi:MAG: hypothetical protein MZV70_65215 [Desulfobacterales bacterium]|nr:hypothetical protein [Desulfobacterales bacterium]
MAIVLMLTFTVGWAQAGPLDLPSTPTATLNVTVDGAPLTVTDYKNVVYVANPVKVKESTGSTYDYQAMNIYVPSNATEDSPIILQDNNGGWNGGKAGTSVTDGASYNGTTEQSRPGVEGGLRHRERRLPQPVSRGRNQDLAGNYIAHAPAQVVDVKAAIRYLRHNDAAMPGTTERIIITGGSGGGALAVAIAASGNGPEYYPYLYELGAAGVTCNGSAIPAHPPSTTTCSGRWPTARSPTWITWTRPMSGCTTPPGRNSAPTSCRTDGHASDWLKKSYVPYFNRLGLRDEKGKRLTAPHFLDAIKALVEKEIEEAYVEVGPAQMAADINALTYKDSSWYSIDANGKATVDMNKYLYFVVHEHTALKAYSGSRQRGFTPPFIPPTVSPPSAAPHHRNTATLRSGPGTTTPSPVTASVTTIPAYHGEIHPDRRRQGGAQADEDDQPDALPGQRHRGRQRAVLVLPSRDAGP